MGRVGVQCYQVPVVLILNSGRHFVIVIALLRFSRFSFGGASWLSAL